MPRAQCRQQVSFLTYNQCWLNTMSHHKHSHHCLPVQAGSQIEFTFTHAFSAVNATSAANVTSEAVVQQQLQLLASTRALWLSQYAAHSSNAKQHAIKHSRPATVDLCQPDQQLLATAHVLHCADTNNWHVASAQPSHNHYYERIAMLCHATDTTHAALGY
jgi:hypothetical protein